MKKDRIQQLIKDLSKILIPWAGGLVLFGLFILSGIQTIRGGKEALYFFTPFYHALFRFAGFLTAAFSALSGILIPGGAVVLISFGGIALFRSRPKKPLTTACFFSLGLAVLGYGFLLGGLKITGLLICFLAVTGMGISGIISSSSPAGNGPKTPFRHRIWLFLIIIFALINCFYRIESIPYHLSGWEVSTGISVLQLQHGSQPDYGKLLWSSMERSLDGGPACPFSVYFLAILFKLFGTSILVVRSAGVVWGLLSLIFLYQMIKNLLGPRTALLATFLTSVSPWFLSIARYSGYISLSLCYVLLVLFVFLRGVREGRAWCLLATGGLAALFSFFYLPVKAIFPILALVWLHSLFFIRRPFLKNTIMAGGFLAGFFLVSLSLGNPFPKLGGVSMPHIFLGSPPHQPGFSLAVALADLKYNSLRLFYNLFYRSHSIEFPAPQTWLIERGVLLLSMLGLGWCAGRWKKTPYFFLAIASVLPLLPIFMVSSRFYGQPLARRCFILAPFMATLAAVSLDAIWDLISEAGKGIGRMTGRTAITFLVAGLTVLGLTHYFNTPAHPGLAVKRAFVERCLHLLDKGYYLEIAQSDYHLRELLDFLSYPMTQRLYTCYPYMGSRYNRLVTLAESMDYHSIGKNPFYRLWSVPDFKERLRTIASSGRKAAILLENEFPYENRPVLMDIISLDPQARIEPIKNREGWIIGFQYLLPGRGQINYGADLPPR